VRSGGDAADDPAIWVHPRRPARSTVIGTDKLSGISVYDLDGREIQYRADGEINNVDLRDGFPLGASRVTLAAVTNRSTQTVGLYRVNRRSGTLAPIDSRVADPDLGVNGICMYRSAASGRFYFFVTGLQGEVEQWRVLADGAGGVRAKRVRSFRLENSAEACVADDRLGAFYIGEEAIGIWRYRAEPGEGTARRLVDGTGHGGKLVADVEGLAIATQGSRGTLIASSQGSNSYTAYGRGRGNEFRYSFEIADGGVDGVEDTDGLDVTTIDLGPGFRHGLLVVQDGSNDDGNQNFKLAPLCSAGSVVCR
jgi:3-phytase